jgi:hypothetical protein
VTERLTCADVDEQDLVSRFVSGRLSEEEAQAFESHCLECDRCWAELRLALSVHAATGGAELHAESRPIAVEQPRRPFLWRAAAIAAGVVLAIVGIRWLWHAPDAQQIERGPGEIAALSLSWTAKGELLVNWPDVGQAARYVVALRTADGRALATRETTESQLTLDARVTDEAAGALVVSVAAYDALGNALGESEPASVPSRPAR